jgi:uncharacterized membrane protein
MHGLIMILIVVILPLLNIPVVHSLVKSLSTLKRYFPIYFILNHLFSKHSPKVITYPIFLKFSPLEAELLDLNTNVNS